jgi:hypothetical protein
MFGSVVLEIAVGLIYLYLLLSTVCSAANEWLAGLFALRGKNLLQSLQALLDDPTVSAIYNHPLIKGLSGADRLPSYISSQVFATALLDVANVADVATGPAAVETLQQRVNAIPNPHVRQVLGALTTQAGETVSGLRHAVALWYDDAMDRASGTYKRRVQLIIFVLAALITGALNADTVTFANRLAQDPALVARVAAAAQGAAQSTASGGQPAAPAQSEVASALEALKLPIGWSLNETDPRAVPRDVSGVLGKLLGLLFTVAAVSLGAPFWFDFLGRVVNLRLSGQPPDPTPPQPPAAQIPQPVQLVPAAPAGSPAPPAAPPAGTAG